MIIDSHCHLKHGDSAATEYRPEEIAGFSKEAGIAKTIVFPMKTTTRTSIEWGIESTTKYPDELIPYVYALPSAKEAILPLIENSVREHGFKGIKIHGAEASLEAHVIDPVIDLAASLQVPCLIDFIGRPTDARRLASEFPKTKIIVPHFGQYLCTSPDQMDQFIQAAKDFENIYLDTSSIVLPWKIQDAVKAIGSERILFGIDGPHPYPSQIEFAKAEILKVTTLDLKDNDMENIMWRSISQLLDLDV